MLRRPVGRRTARRCGALWHAVFAFNCGGMAQRPMPPCFRRIRRTTGPLADFGWTCGFHDAGCAGMAGRPTLARFKRFPGTAGPLADFGWTCESIMPAAPACARFRSHLRKFARDFLPAGNSCLKPRPAASTRNNGACGGRSRCIARAGWCRGFRTAPRWRRPLRPVRPR